MRWDSLQHPLYNECRLEGYQEVAPSGALTPRFIDEVLAEIPAKVSNRRETSCVEPLRHRLIDFNSFHELI